MAPQSEERPNGSRRHVDEEIAEDNAGAFAVAPSPLASDDPTGSQEVTVPLADLSGRQLAHFRLLHQLGAGAMSAVYRARDERSGDVVALKILLPGADRVARSRFQQEAHTAQQLDHAHIVRTYEVGEASEDGMAFISMELIEGESLADLLERHRQLSILDACLILERIARALDYAHRQGIVHRDVKPSNILLRRVEAGALGAVQLSVLDHPVRPLLSDFGIARAMDAPDLTSVGRTVGTPTYMAPEQCSGSHDVDGRADLYALGTVFYRALVGRPPYLGTTTQVLYAHVYHPLMIPDEVLVNLPMPVIDILRRSLAKDPKQRYATAAGLAVDMGRITGNLAGPVATGNVRADEMTATMTALPSTERRTSSSTILVPSRPPGPTPFASTAAFGSRDVAAESDTGQRSRREMRRLSMGIGLAVVVLLALLTLGVLQSISARQAGMAGSATTAAGGANGQEQTDGATDPGPPNAATLEPDDRTPDDAIQTPTPVQTPFFDVASIWNDAEFFYIERDWASTLDQLILLLRADADFNQKLSNDPGAQAQLINELLLNEPENPYWQAHAGLFDPDQIEAMFFQSLVGLAAQANARNQFGRALNYLDDALILRPEDEDVAVLAAATRAVTEANVSQIPDARAALHRAYAAHAALAVAAGDDCTAAEHLTTALNLDAELNPELNADLAAAQARCARAIADEVGQAGLAQLTGSLLYSSQAGDRARSYVLAATPPNAEALIVEDAAHPSLSPWGDRIVLYSTDPDSIGLILLPVADALNAVGAEPAQRITNYLEDGETGPVSWSPDGQQIAFGSTREGDRQPRIYVGRIDDRDSSSAIAYGVDPAWGPGQNWIVHNGTDRTGNQPGLWLRRSDGSDETRLTSVRNDLRPTWTPDGRQLVFTSDGRDGNWEIYRLDLATGGVTRLTNHEGEDVAPAVSPDGASVAFLSDREGAWAVWVMPLDGGEAVRLAAIEGALPDWRNHSLQWVK